MRFKTVVFNILAVKFYKFLIDIYTMFITNVTADFCRDCEININDLLDQGSDKTSVIYIYEGSLKSFRPSLCETWDKRPLDMEPNRSCVTATLRV